MKMTLSSCAALVLVLLVLLIRCCQEREGLQEALEDCQESGAAAAIAPADLVIQHSDAGEWIDFSNLFSKNTCTGRDVTYWPGLLFQIGTYNVPQSYVYDGIELDTNSSGAITYSASDWVWIDIVSKSVTKVGPPINPNDAFQLYPNNSVSTTACPVTPGVAGGCDRNRTISGFMEDVLAVITYWQGDNGYSMTAAQKKDICTGNEFRFTFNDEFAVDVYKPADPLNDTSMPAPTSFPAGEVKSITVKVKTTGPGRGETQPPPWPYP